MDRNKFYDSLRDYNEKDTLIHHGVAGQKWGVKKQQEEKSKYTKEQQAAKLDNAKTKSMYDKDFVNLVKNVSNKDDSIDVLNKEYAEYLKNPDKYMQGFDPKQYINKQEETRKK